MKKLIVLSAAIVFYVCAFAMQGDEYCFVTDFEGTELVDLNHNYRKELYERAEYARGTVFKIDYEGDWSETEKRVVEYACRLWEEKAPTCYPRPILLIRFANLPKNTLYSASVSYLSNDVSYKNHLYGQPTSYLKYLQCEDPDEIDYSSFDFSSLFTKPDIKITLNANKDLYYWGTDGETPADKYDAVTLLIRSIGKCFGLESTLKKEGEVFFCEYSPYDYELTGISDYDYNSPEFNEYVTSGTPKHIDLYRTDFLDLYVPTDFMNGISFSCITEECADSINGRAFAPIIPKGSSFHHIPNEYGELLVRRLDWTPTVYTSVGGEFSSSSTSNCDTALDYGQSYNFGHLTLQSNEESQNITPKRNERNSTYGQKPEEGYNSENRDHLSCIFEMLRADGFFQEISRSSTISPKDVPDTVDWARTADGMLRGRLTLKINKPNGYHMKSYFLFLDYLPEKPTLSLKTVKKEEADARTMPLPKMQLSFNALGSQSVKIKHEAGNDIFYYNYNPDIATIDLDNVNPYVKNKFTLFAVNKNGETCGNSVEWGGTEFMEEYNRITTTIQFSDLGNTIRIWLTSLNYWGETVEDSSVYITTCKIVALNGSFSKEFVVENGQKSVTINKASCPSGLYAFFIKTSDGQQKSFKIMLK